MAGVQDPGPVMAALLYLAPASAILAFLFVKIAFACVFAEPSPTAGQRRRRWTAIVLQTLLAVSVISEAVSVGIDSNRVPGFEPADAYMVNLIVQSYAQVVLLVGLLEESQPIWTPYVLAWAICLGSQLPIMFVQTQETLFEDRHAGFHVASEGSRVALWLVQIVWTGVFTLPDRRRSVKLDPESEAFLANEITEFIDGHADGSPTTSDPANGAVTATSANDHDDEDKERIQKQNAQRAKMREAGSLWNYVKRYKIFLPMIFPWSRLAQFYLLLHGLTSISKRFLNILLPRQLGILVTELTQSYGTGTIPWRAVGLYVFYYWLSSTAGLELVERQAESTVEQCTFKQIFTRSFSHIMGLSMDYHNSKSSGELISTIGEGRSMQDLISYIFFTVVPVLVDLVVAVVYVYTLFDIYMSLILLGFSVAFVYIGLKVASIKIRPRRKYIAARRAERNIQNEAINNWTTVSHFNRGAYETKRYSDAVVAVNLRSWWIEEVRILGEFAQSFVLLVGRVLALLLAIYRVSQGRNSVGEFINLNTYWSYMSFPLRTLQGSVGRLPDLVVDAEKLLELFSTMPSVTSMPGAPPLVVRDGTVEFKNVCFAYDQRRPTLTDISFTVQPGQTVAFVGETGGGKSTMLKLLYRYYDPTAGSITVDGHDLRSVELDSLRENFGMVPQDPALFNMSVLENVRYARLDATDEEIHTACRHAAMHNRIMSFPDGYNTLVGERGVKLSGGEMQRVAIARAFLRNSKIVLLDEATSQIDAETEAEIQTALRRLMRGRTTFVVAHRLATIQHADLIVVVQEGRVAQMGTHDELWQDADGKYRSLWKRQMHRETMEKGDLVDVSEVEVSTGESSASSLKD